MTTPTVKVAHRCEVASTFADAEWVEVPDLECVQIAEGGTQAVGQGAFTLRYGTKGFGGTVEEIPYEDLKGQYVRVVHEALTDVILWHGVLESESFAPASPASAARGEVAISARHILGLLDQFFPVRAIEAGGETDQMTIGPFPPFNEGGIGNMSAADDAVLGVRLFDRGDSAEPWTAYHAIRTLLKLAATDFRIGYATTLPGPIWTIESDNLSWTLPEIAPHGKSVAEVINLIANPQRGLFCRLKSVADDTLTLEVVSTGAVAVTIGDTTLPAATPVALSLDDDPTLQTEVSASPAAYDCVYAFGDRPYLGITLWYLRDDEADPQTCPLLPDGWDPDDQPTPTAEDDRVWRSFRLNPDWNGTSYDSVFSGLPNRIEAEDALPDGLIDWGDTAMIAPAELTTDTPAGKGWVWDPAGQRQDGLVVIGNTGYGWRLLKMKFVCKKDRVLFGADRKDAHLLRALLASSENTLLLTCGIRAWSPLCCAAIPGTYVRERPTVLSIDRKDLGYWAIMPKCVTGVTAGVLDVVTLGQVIRDDTADLQRFAAQAAQQICAPRGSLTYRVHGVIDATTHPPGTLIDPLTVNGRTVHINAILAQRSWHFGAIYGTRYDARPRPPGMRVSG